MVRPLISAFVALLALSLYSVSAHASEAEDLFEQGRSALQENRLDAACDLFRRSQALEAAPGTVLNLADCEERRGNRVLAHRLFSEVATEVEPLFSSEGKKRAALLKAQLSTVTVRIEGTLPPGARLTLDGVDIAANEARLVEPGQHVATLSEPSTKLAETKRESLAAGQSSVLSFRINQGTKLPDKPAEGPVEKPAGPTTEAPSIGIAGIVIGSVGVATLAAAMGTGFAMLDIGECFPAEGEPDEGCDRSAAAADEGKGLEVASTALFVAGGVLSATGVVLVAVAPWDDGSKNTTASLGLGPGHVALGVSF